MNIIRESEQVAKKFYNCDACHIWDNSGYGQKDVTPDDWLIVEACKADKWKIVPCQKYLKVIYDDGGLTTYRARIDMDNLCHRLGFFEWVGG